MKIDDFQGGNIQNMYVNETRQFCVSEQKSVWVYMCVSRNVYVGVFLSVCMCVMFSILSCGMSLDMIT